MKTINIKKGFDIPLKGSPIQEIRDEADSSDYAVLGEDFVGLKPRFQVSEGDYVKKGDVLFIHKKDERIKFTSPVAGEIKGINRGEKRKFLSIVIRKSSGDSVSFDKYSDFRSIPVENIKEQLLNSGLWPSFVARPYGKLADPDAESPDIFITASDTRPFAPGVVKAIGDNFDSFYDGVDVISGLTKSKVYVCVDDEDFHVPSDLPSNVEIIRFTGQHPAGLAGTHIHFLSPASREKTVWQIGYQDVIAFGKLFREGEIYTERVISVAGEGVREPVLVKTNVGVNVNELLKSRLNEDKDYRVISGSPIYGRKCVEPVDFLGKFDYQISVLPEGGEREFLGWMTPGKNKFSIKNVFTGSFFRKKFSIDTSVGGSKRAIVPIGSYEKVMPLDIIPTYLLRYLEVGDFEMAEKLGCMELLEEDLSLCTFVCPGKIDHCKNLRDVLTTLEKET